MELPFFNELGLSRITYVDLAIRYERRSLNSHFYCAGIRETDKCDKCLFGGDNGGF